MRIRINGLSDISTVLLNLRKVGGAVEAASIRLRSGEEFAWPVIVSLERAGDQFYAMGLVTQEGEHLIIHTGDVGRIRQVRHVDVKALHNRVYRERRQRELLQHLERLCEVNRGFVTPTFREEVLRIVEDIGWEAAEGLEEIRRLRQDHSIVRMAV